MNWGGNIIMLCLNFKLSFFILLSLLVCCKNKDARFKKNFIFFVKKVFVMVFYCLFSIFFKVFMIVKVGVGNVYF